MRDFDALQGKWSDPVDAKTVFLNFTLIFEYIYSNGLNPVLWSLAHELRFYIIFPLLIYFLVRLDGILLIGLVFLMMYVGYEGLITKLKLSFSISYGLHVTLIYLPTFVSGMILCKYADILRDFYLVCVNNKLEFPLLLVALVLYTYKWTFYGFSAIHGAYFDYGAVILASCIFIISSFSSKRVSGILMHPVLLFMGKISFGLYLYHFVVLLTFLYAFGGRFSLWVILVGAFFFSIVISYFSCRYVEVPTNRYIGRKFS